MNFLRCLFLFSETIFYMKGSPVEVPKVPLYISPRSPVRLEGQELKLTVTAGHSFMNEHGMDPFHCYVDFGKERELLPVHLLDKESRVFYTTTYIARESADISAVITDFDEMELTHPAKTRLTVVKDQPKLAFVIGDREDQINCLEGNNGLRYQWLKNNITVDGGNQQALTLTAVKEDASSNLTCIIATAAAVRDYGSVQAAFAADSAISIRRELSVISLERIQDGGNRYNLSIQLHSRHKMLTMALKTMEGYILAEGDMDKVITVNQNETEALQLIISDKSGATLFIYNVTEETFKKSKHVTNDNSGLSSGLIAAIVITVLLIVGGSIIIAVVCYRRNRNSNNVARSAGSKGGVPKSPEEMKSLTGNPQSESPGGTQRVDNHEG